MKSKNNISTLTPDTQLEKVNTAAKITERYKDALTQYIQGKQTVREYAKMLFVTPNYYLVISLGSLRSRLAYRPSNILKIIEQYFVYRLSPPLKFSLSTVPN